MKILYVVIDGKVSGGNNICAAILRAARQAGHQVELLTPNLGPLTESLIQEGIKVHVMDLTRSFYFHRSFQLACLLKKWRIELVHTHTSLNPEILCRFACFLAGVPMICHQHDPTDVYHPNPLLARYQRWLDRVTSKLVPQFVAVSKYRMDVMVKERGYSRDKVELIYNGIDVHRFERANGRQAAREEWRLQSNEVAIGLIARLEPAKGHETLIEAVPLVLQKFPRTKFFIIGDDHIPGRSYGLRCRGLIQSLGVGRNCFLLGAKEEIDKWIQGLDIVVLPSWWEGHPLVLLEALAARRPVVASLVGGVPEVVTHEQTGLLIPPKDPSALAQAILRWIENAELRRQLAKNGYEKVRKQFNQEQMIKQVFEIYKQFEKSNSLPPLWGKVRMGVEPPTLVLPHKGGGNLDPRSQGGATTVHVPNARLAVVTEIISPYRVPVFNGIARVLGRQFKVFFMAETCPGRAWEVPYSKIKFDYEVLSGVNLNRNRKRPNPLYWNPGIGKVLEKFSPDVIVIGGYHHFTSFLVGRYAKRHSNRLILWCESTLHDDRFRNLISESFKKRFIHSCDGYLVPGKASEEYLRFYGVRRPVFYAPNAIDVEMFQLNSVPIEEKREEEKNNFRRRFQLPGFNLLYVGRLAPEKGLPTLFRAVEYIQGQGVEVGLVLVGDGPCRKEYERQVLRLGLKHVLFLGFKQQEELSYYYLMADLLVLPSHSEPWGLVVNESLACGLPVLCSEKVGCAQDLIVEGRTGYLCADVEAYGERIVELMKKPEHLRQMRGYCRAHINQFTPERSADGFLSLCEGAVGPAVIDGQNKCQA